LGDFNLPSINWVDGCGQITSHPSYGADLNNSFLDLVNDIGLNQFVNTPTRNSNVLDLVLSTSTSILDLTTTPGMSDHEAIVFNCTINNANFKTKPDHKVALYHRANLDNIKGDLLEFQTSFITNDPYGKTVEQNWTDFKNAINTSVAEHVPYKTIHRSQQQKELKLMRTVVYVGLKTP